MDNDTATIYLLDIGLKITSPTQIIFRQDLHTARVALGLSHSRQKIDLCLIQNLSERAGVSEIEARDRLVKAGLLAKRCLKRVPHHTLTKVEEFLGLRPKKQSTSTSSPSVTPKKEKRKPKPPWPTVGRPQELIYLKPEDVLDFHYVLVRDFAKSKNPIYMPGPRSRTYLDSAIHRQRTSLGTTAKYPTVSMAAASLLYGIVLGHPFHDGNTRTALVATLVFLDKNGWVLTCDEDEIYKFLLQLADHKLIDSGEGQFELADKEVIEVAQWLLSRIKKVARKEQTLRFRNLRSILEGEGCELEILPGNRINIRRGHFQTQVFYQKAGADVDKNTTHKIRKDLHLDEEHGYDSDIFYNRSPRIPDFINKYRKLLDKLAKV